MSDILCLAHSKKFRRRLKIFFKLFVMSMLVFLIVRLDISLSRWSIKTTMTFLIWVYLREIREENVHCFENISA